MLRPDTEFLSALQVGLPAASGYCAASLGGPAAVKTFPIHLPADLPVALCTPSTLMPLRGALPSIIGAQNDCGHQLRSGYRNCMMVTAVRPIKRRLPCSTPSRVQPQ